MAWAAGAEGSACSGGWAAVRVVCLQRCGWLRCFVSECVRASVWCVCVVLPFNFVCRPLCASLRPLRCAASVPAGLSFSLAALKFAAARRNHQPDAGTTRPPHSGTTQTRSAPHSTTKTITITTQAIHTHTIKHTHQYAHQTGRNLAMRRDSPRGLSIFLPFCLLLFVAAAFFVAIVVAACCCCCLLLLVLLVLLIRCYPLVVPLLFVGEREVSDSRWTSSQRRAQPSRAEPNSWRSQRTAGG